MKTKFKPIFLFLIFVLFIFYSWGEKADEQNPQWKGKIEKEDGIKVIKNPGEPLYGKIKFELKEDLSIGKEDDENYMFYRVRGIAVDNQGNIYITDWGNYRIQKFGQNGNYLQTIGRQGEGPGEFQWLIQLRMDDSTGNIFVKDGPREIEKFDKKGNYIETIKMEKSIDDFYFTGEGLIFAILSTVSETELSKTLCKVNTKGEILKNYAKFPWDIYYQKRGEGAVMSVSSFVHDLFLSKIDGKCFLYGYSGEYELNVIDHEGRILYKITKDESPKGFSAKEKRRYKRGRMPAHKPFFYSLFTDSKARIYAQTNMISRREPADKEVDVFSKDGYYLYKTTLPRFTYAIKNGFLYAYEMNEDTGAEYVKRYRIKNWDKIKDGI